jgi:hypothetical protein
MTEETVELTHVLDAASDPFNRETGACPPHEGIRQHAG